MLPMWACRANSILPPQAMPLATTPWLDADPKGGIAFDPDFFIQWPESHRPHQVRLEGGDCSSDSYCYP